MKLALQAQSKFVLQVIGTIIACFLLQYFLPWWTLAVGAFGVAWFLGNKGFISFLAGFIASALLWFLMALYSDVTTKAILTQKVNQLLPLPALLMTAIIGGLVGGFAALTGSVLKTAK